MHLAASPTSPSMGIGRDLILNFAPEVGQYNCACALTTQPCADHCTYTRGFDIEVAPRCGAVELRMFQIPTNARTGGGGACH